MLSEEKIRELIDEELAKGPQEGETVKVPNWLVRDLAAWAERAYRRGYQQGMFAANTLGHTYDEEGAYFRYGCDKHSSVPNSFHFDADYPDGHPCSLEERHFGADPIWGLGVFPAKEDGFTNLVKG